MNSRLIYVRGGGVETVRAREALGGMKGVVAAEFVPGRSAVRVYCGEETTKDMLLGRLRDQGLQGE